MKENLENYKKALESNKEDVDYIIELFSETYAEVQRLNEYVAVAKKKERNNEIMINIMIPVATVPMIVTGGILMATNNDFGKPVLYTGVGLLVGCELVYNGGHFLFKIW